MANDNDRYGGERQRADSQRELKDALERLERAVQDLAGTAKDEWAEWTERATAFIDDTSSRLEDEVSTRRERAHRKAQAHPVVAEPANPRAGGLRRDRRRGKLGGVCAGLGAYWDMEPWVVRCIAITALLFFPGVTLPAYLIAWLVLSDDAVDPSRRRRGRRGRRHQAAASAAEHEPPRQDLPPRAQYKSVQSVLSQAELRLRRMETHVTSGQYELQKELHAIDDGKASPAS